MNVTLENTLFALALGLSLGMLGASCPPPEPTPPTPPDSGTPCERACERLEQLGCPGAEGTPEGTPCETVCEDTENSGVARFCPDEVADIDSCAELEDAFEACE